MCWMCNYYQFSKYDLYIKFQTDSECSETQKLTYFNFFGIVL